jgi:hypothetical protein
LPPAQASSRSRASQLPSTPSPAIFSPPLDGSGSDSIDLSNALAMVCL